MKSAYQIAKDLGVSHQAVYKRLTPEYIAELGEHAISIGDGYRFDITGEAAIKSLFGRIAPGREEFVQAENTPEMQVIYRYIDQRLINQLHIEIERLREDLRVERERSYGLAMQLAELSRSS